MHTTRDLANILQLMQTSRQSGDLIVEPVVQSATPWQGLFRLVDGQVTFCQVRGKIDRRVLLRDNEAMHWLINASQAKVEWSLEESAPLPSTFLPLMDDASRGAGNTSPNLAAQNNMNASPTSPNSVMRTNRNSQNTSPGSPTNAYPLRPYADSRYGQPGTIPKRTEIGNKAPGMVLSSRDLRQVFALIDGVRTVEEIARLLHKPPELVTQLLNELQANSLID